MEKFLNKRVTIIGAFNHSLPDKGVVTSIDEEFVCLDETKFIARKNIYI
jgi:hypothetical protein